MDDGLKTATGKQPYAGFVKGQSGNPNGRKKGVPNKVTLKREAAIASTGITPLEYMLKTLRDETLEHKERMDAATSAAPYCHPKLATIAHTGPDGGAINLYLNLNDAAL